MERGVDYFCLSDRLVPSNSAWCHLPLPYDAGNGSASNRYVKMHPHLLFPDYDISVYIDGNIQLVSAVTPIVLDSMRKADMALYQHPFRSCIYEEAAECTLLGHDWSWRISAQMRRYRLDGFPSEWGLFEGNVIVRKHRQPDIVRLMGKWWEEYRRYVRRDQLSLTYLAWKHSVPILNLGLSDPRGARKVFSLQKTHTDNSLIVRLRRAVNRRLRAAGFFEIPIDA